MRRFVVILALFLASCTAKKQAAEFEAQPEWIKQKPIIPGYYVGIASVKKVGTSAQYIAKARQEALADLAESVSSSVSSSSVLRSIETEYGYSESFDQKIQVSTDDYLEGFDPVDSYENEGSYWVYYKISKSTYQEMKDKKKKEAVATALAKYQSGMQEQNLNKPKEAIAFYLQGLQAIKRYLSEETTAQIDGNSIDIGNEIYSSVGQILNALTIEAVKSSISLKRGEAFKENLEFRVTYNQNPVQGIPIEFTYTGGYLKKDRQNSDLNGLVQLEPEVLYSRNGKEQLSANIDLKDLAQKAVDDVFIRGLITKRNMKPAMVQVIIEAPSIALMIKDKSCSDDECNRIKNIFDQNTKQYGFELKAEKSADYIFELSFSHQRGESAGGLVSTYISGKLNIKDKTNTLVWAKQIDGIKGVGSNLHEAKSKALSEFQTTLDRKYFKQGMDAIK